MGVALTAGDDGPRAFNVTPAHNRLAPPLGDDCR